MGLLFRLLSVFAAASRLAVRPLLAVSSGLSVVNKTQIPDDMYYGMYALRDRYSMDHVPLQNCGAKETVEHTGKKSVHIKKLKIDFARRFCTFNVTVRAIPDQNHPSIIVFRGKPSVHDPRRPVSPMLQKEIPLYDKRVVVMFDPMPDTLGKSLF